jgi:hypothetical protein
MSINSSSSSSPSLGQVTMNSGPWHQVVMVPMTTQVISSPLAATPCRAASTLQRSNFGRPSSAAAHAACLRASTLQQSRPTTAITRNAAAPSQGARARAASRFQSTSPSNDVSLNADMKLDNDLQTALTRAHKSKPTCDGVSAAAVGSQAQECSESSSLEEARSLDKKLSRIWRS